MGLLYKINLFIPIPEDSNKLELKRQIEEELKNLEKPVVKVNLINVEEAKSKLKNLQEEIIPLKENLKKEIKKKVKEKADKLAEAEEEEELERQRKKEKKLLDNLSKALDVVNKTKIEDAKKREEAKKIRRRSRKKNKRK